MNYAEKLDRVLLLAGSLLDRIARIEHSRGRADAAEFDESKHPRAEDGKFGEGTSAASKGKSPKGPALKLPVRAPSESVAGVLEATFSTGRIIGPKTMKIDQMKGGVPLNDPEQAARIAALKEKMTGPGGFISRPIVDTEGNVIEGQHRLEALRQLGVTNVPVYVIQDLAAGIDAPALKEAMNASQPMRSDQRNQIAAMLLEALADEGSVAAVEAGYEAPRGYAEAWTAGIQFLKARQTNETK